MAQAEVSWNHAEVWIGADGLWLRDLGSRNGTQLNGAEARGACRLADGDTIEVGRTRLSVRARSAQGPPSRGVRLDAEGLTHAVWSDGRPLTVLSNVSLAFRPGEMVAILGASGAGKTSLLLALAGFQSPDAGRVAYDGVDVYRHADAFRQTVGYVPQADIVHNELHLDRALRYTARLRLGRLAAEAEIDRAVARSLVAVDLASRANAPIRSLSGGERKRANIAAELLTQPGLLFLDEPTSGLDAGLERRIVRGLRDLAREGRTVVCVTHSLEAIEEFDRIVVMAKGGRLAFTGSVAEGLAFFRVGDLADVYDVASDPSLRHATRFALRRPALSGLAHRAPPNAAGWDGAEALAQASLLIRRYVETIRSDVRNLAVLAAQAPVIAAILMVVYDDSLTRAQQSPDASGHLPVQDLPTLLLLMTLSVVCFGLLNACREIVKERRIFDRERRAGLGRAPYVASKVSVQAAIVGIEAAALLSLVLVRVPMGFPMSTGLWALGLLTLAGLNAVLAGLCVSVSAKSADQAVTLAAPLMLVWVVFSGLVPLDRLGPLSPLASLSAPRWAFGGLCGLADVPGRFEHLGLGAQANGALRTDPATATLALVALTLAFSVLLGSLIARSRSFDVR